MAKFRSLFAVLTVLLILSACQGMPDDNQSTASTPSATVPTTQPTAPPADQMDGLAFVYKANASYILPGWRPNKAQKNCLYWVYEDTKEYFLLCEDPVTYCLTTDTHVYYVKEAEPTNIYAIPIGDFTNHQLLQETPLPVVADGLAFRDFGSNNIVLMPDWQYKEGTLMHLYWVIKSTKEVFVICDEPVAEYETTDTHVYYVKESEPTKLYRTPIGDFSVQEMVYECAYGSISSALIDTYTIRKELILQFVAGNKKFMVWDLNTGEEHCVLEWYYIAGAMFEDSCTDTWKEQREILIWGQRTAEEPLMTYRYDMDTGILTEEHECMD